MKFNKYILTPTCSAVVNHAERNAFCIAGQFYSYEVFGQCISKIRLAIQHAPIHEDIWGLVANDDIETYAAIFALWMEGKAYTPLHPLQPIERCKNIIQQIGLHNVLDSSETSRYTDENVIYTSTLQYTEDCLDDWVEVPETNLAYILFTSGSTGVPKGVTLSRQNIAAFMDSFWQTGINITHEDHCMQCFDLTFDVSVQSYLVALTRGACVYTIPSGSVKYLAAASLIMEHKITFGAMAPSMLTYLKPYFVDIDATSLKACILTAEACPVALMEEWYKCAINAELYDFYGPTEATIYCTYYKLTRGGENRSLNGIISIGKPLANVQAIIIDEDYNIVPQGEKGELCVAGAQVTPGYWDNPEKNASSFFEKEVNGEVLRFYHTGDLCYEEVDGNIMYSGRIDQQAKIQGFRVELGEIEFHARKFLQQNVIAIAFDNSNALTEIALFIEAEETDSKPLITYLKEQMPHYMIPSRIIYEPQFPLNSSDKIDRNKLKSTLS